MAQIDLHVHPFKNSIYDIVNAMDSAGIDVLGLESLDASIYKLIVEQANKAYPYAAADDAGVKLPNGKFLLNGREYTTLESLHLLTIGFSYEPAKQPDEAKRIIEHSLEHNAIVILDHPFVDNGKTKTAGHVSSEFAGWMEYLCKEYSGHVALEWNAYCIPWMRNVLMQGLNLAGLGLSYYDVNLKAEELSAKLQKEEYNVPILADTDLHARNKRLLQRMGTARVISPLEGSTAYEIVQSLKRNIFARNYENVKEYVSSAHLLEAFCLPVVFPGLFEKSRG